MVDTLAEMLSQLHEFNMPFNPPAATAQLDELAARLNCTLNDSLVTIYRDHNGIQPGWDESNWRLRFALRLMACEEVIATHHMLRDYEADHPEDCFPPDAKYFWNEGSSDYAGVYLSGVLAGKVCLYDHEVLDFAPRFRSVTSFYAWHIRYLMALAALESPDDMHSWHDDDIPSDSTPSSRTRRKRMLPI